MSRAHVVDAVSAVLARASSPLKAREIAIRLRERGLDLDRATVNSVLYGELAPRVRQAGDARWVAVDRTDVVTTTKKVRSRVPSTPVVRLQARVRSHPRRTIAFVALVPAIPNLRGVAYEGSGEPGVPLSPRATSSGLLLECPSDPSVLLTHRILVTAGRATVGVRDRSEFLFL